LQKTYGRRAGKQSDRSKSEHRMKRQLWSLVVILSMASSTSLAAGTQTFIELDGETTRVYFNDGDTFKVLSGPLKGKRSRLNGFNTLESYGPVHKWGTFSKKELLSNANEATQLVRKGGWHCKSEDSVDIYGRLLSTCTDMALALLEKGLAHAMNVSEEPADDALVAKQQEAIKAKRGMWSKGVPAYIVTSLHSVNEKDGQEQTYNRAVSTADGHSFMMVHKEAYSDCEEVCYSPDKQSEASCMVYVKFENRYGPRRPSCLR
jgi:endonuclease YncB( thermonuclease family)